jgi:1-deoxy-D-xylulose-5-phosphate reductoisomerase
VLNAANEVAVASFLAGALGFSRIPALIEAVLAEVPCVPVAGLEDVLAADRVAREKAESWLRAAPPAGAVTAMRRAAGP